MHVLRRAALAFVPVLVAGCLGDGGLDVADYHDHGEPVGSVSSALEADDPVSLAVTESCTTTSVMALATQLMEEVQCLEPGAMKRIDGIPGLTLGSAVFPYLQVPAADALVAAQQARGVTMTINSGLRTLPQQYLLYRWYQARRCGIGLAAKPGASNHESGVAVDIKDNAAWRSAMTAEGFRWLGASDPVHFDYIGGETLNMRGLSILAFQRLWNRNHPEDVIKEDGLYGPATEARLVQSPVGGFRVGADCNAPPPVIDIGRVKNPPGTIDAVPDAMEPTEEIPPEAPAAPEARVRRIGDPLGEGGCSLTAARVGGGFAGEGLALVAAALLLRRRRSVT